jgi:DNA polymerase I-like protein with 3'-5' exonuclease and polymerase domains
MRSLILDVETTISNKGNPFDERNKLCYVGLYSNNTHYLYDIDYSGSPNRSGLDAIQGLIDSHDIIVGFNLKFDLHWIRRYGINIVGKRVWDCQLVHFILNGQTTPYPSLDGVAAHYDLGSKLDVIASEYWKNGIDTPSIPKDLLEDYLIQDLRLTQQVYDKQMEEFAGLAKQTQRLISLHNQDLLVLEEMEYNGILFDETTSNRLGDKLEESVRNIDRLMFAYHNLDEFNPSSTEHVSSLLYGGAIKIKRKEVVGVFKTGARAGQPKERWFEYEIKFDRLVTPLKGSELEKEGFFSIDDQTLKSLKFKTNKAKELVELILTRATLEKRLTAYYRGLVDLRTKMNWPIGKLHGVLNQCVAKTGRLSSTKPNLQNFDGEIKQLFGSRYATAS